MPEGKISSPASEQLFLASCLHNKKAGEAILAASPGMFTEERMFIFDVMYAMAKKGMAIDLTTFKAEFARRFPTKEMDSAEMIRQARTMKNPDYAASYFTIIRNYAILRQANGISSDLVMAISAGQDPMELIGILRRTEMSMLDTMNAGQQQTTHDYMKDVTEYLTGPKTADIMMTGLDGVDRHGGYPTKIFHLIAARYGVGKTPLALRIMLHNAVEKGIPVAFWSGENSVPSMIIALISMMTGISLRSLMLREEDANPVSKKAIRAAQKQIMGAPIHWLPWGRKTVYQLKAEFKRRYERHGFKIAILDQFSHIIPDRDIKDRNLQMDMLSDELFSWNEDMPAWWLCLAQLKTKYVEERPKLADVMWATRLEQNCDCGWVLDRPTADTSRVKSLQDDTENTIRTINRSRGMAPEMKTQAIAETKAAMQRKLRPVLSQEKGRMGLGTFIEILDFDEEARGFFVAQPELTTTKDDVTIEDPPEIF